jgi:hypothetical protein
MDLTTGVFTAPRDGVYHFDFSGVKDSSADRLGVRLQLNGVNIAHAYTWHSTSASNNMASLHSTLQLKSGDRIDLFLSGGQLFDSSNHYTSFTGSLLEEDLSLTRCRNLKLFLTVNKIFGLTQFDFRQRRNGPAGCLRREFRDTLPGPGHSPGREPRANRNKWRNPAPDGAVRQAKKRHQNGSVSRRTGRGLTKKRRVSRNRRTQTGERENLVLTERADREQVHWAVMRTGRTARSPAQ